MSMFHVEEYLAPLGTLFRAHADADKAAPMAQYMRNLFPFYGIPMPKRREIFRDFLKEHGQPPIDQVEDVVWTMWERPQRENQYLALGLLEKMRHKLEPEAVALFEKLTINKSWWDTVDSLASYSGFHFERYPILRDPWIAKWRKADDFWLRRVTLLFQLKYKDATDVGLLFSLIEENRHSDEFFVQKAIGWALREYSKTDAQAVKQFVAQTKLAPLSAREGLKWLKKQQL